MRVDGDHGVLLVSSRGTIHYNNFDQQYQFDDTIVPVRRIDNSTVMKEIYTNQKVEEQSSFVNGEDSTCHAPYRDFITPYTNRRKLFTNSNF